MFDKFDDRGKSEEKIRKAASLPRAKFVSSSSEPRFCREYGREWTFRDRGSIYNIKLKETALREEIVCTTNIHLVIRISRDGSV